MTTPSTHTTRLDKCPPGLVHVAAHGEITGGLAIKLRTPNGLYVFGLGDKAWNINPGEQPDFEGVPLTPIPTETAAASTDPRVRAYVKERHS